jgi:hypothetical protein
MSLDTPMMPKLLQRVVHTPLLSIRPILAETTAETRDTYVAQGLCC